VRGRASSRSWALTTAMLAEDEGGGSTERESLVAQRHLVIESERAVGRYNQVVAN
jgi:hypothetical protein